MWCRSTKPICRAARRNGSGRRTPSTACSTRSTTTPAVHLCFGNYGGQTIQKGSWGKLIDYLNALHVDHIVMENAHRPPEELAVFRELRPEIGFGLGVVDIKQTVIESADAIARAIEHADKVLGAAG